MREQYDAIGESYERVKQHMALARVPERATFDTLLGDCGGKSVLDLACGTGWYSRLARTAGAASVTGVDVSTEMIDAAERAETRDPLGNRYLCADARVLGPIGRFDLVTAVWLLCYATDAADLSAMARTAYDNLAPDGVYVGVEMNPWFDWHGPPATKYGLTHSPEIDHSDGKTLTVTAHVEPPFSFAARFWRRDPIVAAFRNAGFRRVEFPPAVLPVESGDAFWAEFRVNPVIVGVKAIK